MKTLAAFITSLILLLAQISYAGDFSKNFYLSIEKWVKSSEGMFLPVERFMDEKKITLAFDHNIIEENFDGFSLKISSYYGISNSHITIEQNLSKEGHPFNDPVVGISRNHFGLKNAHHNQNDYINYYVNLDDKTKLRIRMQAE